MTLNTPGSRPATRKLPLLSVGTGRGGLGAFKRDTRTVALVTGCPDVVRTLPVIDLAFGLVEFDSSLWVDVASDVWALAFPDRHTLIKPTSSSSLMMKPVVIERRISESFTQFELMVLESVWERSGRDREQRLRLRFVLRSLLLAGEQR